MRAQVPDFLHVADMRGTEGGGGIPKVGGYSL